MGDNKPIIRIAVPGDSAEEFMQNAAKQFRGDFFVAIDQAVGKFVRIEAPFLAGDVGVRGDAIAMPAVRNGKKGLVVRLVKLDPDSLGIPIPEATATMDVDEPEEATEDEFAPQPTMASPVSAAVAKSIRATASAADRALPVKAQGTPVPRKLEPTKLDELDDETREAVDEFAPSAATTKASDATADLAKQLADLEAKEPRVTPAVVRRAPPEKSGSDKHEAPTVVAKPAPAPEPPPEPPTDDDEPAVVTDTPVASETKPAAPPRKSHVQFLIMCLLLTLVGVAAIALLKGWV